MEWGVVAGFIGILLTVFVIVLLFSVNLVFGSLFFLYVIIVVFMYLRLRRKGRRYLKELAQRTGLLFKGSLFGYGKLAGVYRGFEVEVSIESGYKPLRSLMGLSLSLLYLGSTLGVLAGLKNFTVVRIRHGMLVGMRVRLKSRLYIEDEFALYYPKSDGLTGLPKHDAKSFVAELNNVIRRISTYKHKNSYANQ